MKIESLQGRCSFFLSSLFFLFFLIMPVSAANLLKNSDFSQVGASGIPEGWSAFCPAAGSDGTSKGNSGMFSIDSTVTRRDKPTLKLKSDTLVRIGLVQSKLDVKPGQKLRFSCWVKGENVKVGNNSGGWVRLAFSNYADPEKHKVAYRSSGFLKFLKETFDWEFQEAEVTVPAENEVADLGLFLWVSSGTVWFSAPVVEIIP